jgi:secreted trypsin-like serine protease
VKKIIFLSIFSLVISNSLTPAKAIEGGEQKLGTNLVLPIMVENPSFPKNPMGNSFYKPLFRCSASLITSQIILTAGHCLAQANTSDGSLYVAITSLKLFIPGVDFSLTNSAVSVDKVVLVPGYANYWKPENNDFRTQKDDIAFLFLSKPLSPELADYKIEIANEAEVNSIKQNGSLIEHYGYGFQSPGLGNGLPYLVKLQAHPLGSSRYANNPAENSKTISTNETGVKAICPGDSGGPWYSVIDGKLKLVATTVGGSGCGNGSLNGTMGTLVYPYVKLMEQEWQSFKSTIPEVVQSPKSTQTPAEKISKFVNCIKGKISKKVMGANPVCPKGYKKSRS